MKTREWGERLRAALVLYRASPGDWSLLAKAYDLGQQKPEPQPWFRQMRCTHLRRDVLIYGEIPPHGEREFCEQFGGRKPLHLYLDCPGGNGETAAKIHRWMRERGRVFATVRRAHSAASVVALGADKISIQASGTFLLHPPRGSAFDAGPQELRALADELEREDPAWESLYQERTGQPLATVREWLQGETVFTGQEAVRAGLAHELVPDAPLEEVLPPSGLLPPLTTDENLFWSFTRALGSLEVENPDTFRASAIAWLEDNVRSNAL